MFNYYCNTKKGFVKAFQSYLAKSAFATLIMVSLFSILLPSQGFAATGNETIPGALALDSGLKNISVISPFTGDGNATNQATLSYKEHSSSTWRSGIDMTVDRRATYTSNSGSGQVSAANPYVNQWRAVIFGLTENTSYDVMVTYTDVDGGSGSVSGTVSTRNSNPSMATNHTYYVAKTGNDTTGNGSSGTPWLTIGKAVSMVAAGDTVRIRAGTYSEQVVVATSGTLTNYITFTSDDPANRAVITSNPSQKGTIRISNKAYNRFNNLDIYNTATGTTGCDVYVTGASSIGNIIDGCLLSSAANDYYGGGVWVESGPADTIIKSNTITTSVTGTNGPFGVGLNATGGSNDISYNTVTGGFYDGLGGGGANSSITGSGYINSYIYNNTVSGTQDDAIEFEGGDINCAVYNNTVHNGQTMGIATAPVLIGPMYIIGNTIYDIHQYAYKIGSSSGGFLYYFHNTVYDSVGQGLTSSGNDAIINNVTMKNNIIEIYGTDQHAIVLGAGSDTSTWYCDYDKLYSNLNSGVIKFVGTNYTWASWRTTYGQEAHGLNGTNTFTNSAAGDFSLAAGNNCIDAGVVITGINDAGSPWAYKGNAPDMGALEYQSASAPNNAPVLGAIGNKTVNEGELLTFTISASDPDNNPLTYSSSNLPSGASFTPATQAFLWTPSYNQAGTYSNVSFSVTDGALSNSQNITITVNNVNRAPVLTAIGNKSATEGQLLSFTVSATDPDSNPLTYSASNLPLGATFNAATRTFTWTPSAGQAGTYTVNFLVSDGTLNDTEAVTVTVNAAPSANLPLRVESGGTSYTDTRGNLWQADKAYTAGSWGFYGLDNSVDYPTRSINGTNDARIYQSERYAMSGYRFDLSNGTYNVVLHFAENYDGITHAGQRVFDVSVEGQLVLDNFDVFKEAGLYTALIKTINGVSVTDGQLNIDFTSVLENPEINGIEIFAAATNHPPVLSTIGNKTVNEGQSLTFTVSATDPDNNPLTYSASSLPSGATFDASTRTFTWTPSVGQAGSYTVNFQVSDGTLNDTEAVTVIVNAPIVNHPPVLGAIGNKTVNEGQSLTFTISATDPDNNPLTYSASNLPLGATFNATSRTFSWTPASGQAGSYTANFLVSDGNLNDSEAITITVNAVVPADTTPPQVTGITSVVVSPTGVNIQWNTNESSTSQVEYAASPSQRSPEDDNLVTSHLVPLSGLLPGTTYTYKVISSDSAGNLAVVDGGTFTTPSDQAVFSVSSLTVNPKTVYQYTKVTISVMAKNTGSTTSTYRVTLKINGNIETSKNVTLAAGSGQTISFTTTKSSIGTYTVEVNGLMSSFQVKSRYHH